MTKYLVDYHLHTEYSDDAIIPMEEVVLNYINKGFKEICFTDHVDYGMKLDWGEEGIVPRLENGLPLRNVDYDRYFKQIEDLQEKYKDQIIIRKGLEFGIQTITIDKFQKLYDKYPMDFVILSIHQVNNQEIWINTGFYDVPQKEGYRKYYNEYLEIMKNFKDYSTIGHLDYINRYDPHGLCDPSVYMDIVDEIFKLAIKENKAVEYNTGSMLKYDDSYNNIYVTLLKRYYELGGRNITIGDDCHKGELTGLGIPEGYDVLKYIGFKQFCTFENMKPIFHEL